MLRIEDRLIVKICFSLASLGAGSGYLLYLLILHMLKTINISSNTEHVSLAPIPKCFAFTFETKSVSKI